MLGKDPTIIFKTSLNMCKTNSTINISLLLAKS